MVNYKKVSELQLEVVELEGRILLVNNNNVNNSPYLLHGNIIYSNKYSNKVASFNGVKYDECKRIITSTSQLKTLPLLVIEDEVDDLAEDHTNIRILQHKTSIQVARQYFDGFKEGYNKSKETFKFTEEHLREAVCEAWNSCENNEDEETFTQVFNRIIQSLTKKELWIEVEGYKVNGMIDEATSYRPKITEGKIKAVWK